MSDAEITKRLAELLSMPAEDVTSGLKDMPQRSLLYTSIGQAISIWALMETKVVRIFARLMRTVEPKAGLVLYSINNTHTWLSIVTELFAADEKYKALAPRWNKINETIRTNIDTRTRLAHHSKWSAGANEVAIRASRLDTRSKWKDSGSLTTEQVIEFSKRIVDLDDRLDSLLSELDAA